MKGETDRTTEEMYFPFSERIKNVWFPLEAEQARNTGRED